MKGFLITAINGTDFIHLNYFRHTHSHTTLQGQKNWRSCAEIEVYIIIKHIFIKHTYKQNIEYADGHMNY